ncbi:MAG: DUF4153 domain-containing protein [Chitinophagaceae bacterium]|nr:DUF4153 domain-containing protein [Chitinophagaceae bacterium]
MKFPSLSSLFSSAGRTFSRFPLAILLASAGTALCIVMVHKNVHEDDAIFVRCFSGVISSYLGMLLSIAVTAWTEQQGWVRRKTLGLQAFVLLLTVLYYFMMPKEEIDQRMVIRWVLFALGLHWLIAVVGFTGKGHINSFWQYNKRLFLRILTSLLYTGVLYLGVSLALLAIDHLFNVDVSYKCYMDTWLVLIGIFNTWFFLAGFPGEYGDIDVIRDYPRGLKIFTQYVLLPILMVYMAILYVYLLKIVVTANWPSGWVAYLVLGFSAAGILALLLIYPLRNDEGNRWINGYSRFFYFALFPLLVLLGFAIWKRVAEYGITESRYFVLLLAVWLLCMAVYFLRSKIKDIRLIPLSLCLIAFLSSFGPWGAFSVSGYSQKTRLKGLLKKYGLFAEGRVRGADVKVQFKDRKEISSITEYLVDMHGYQSMQPLFYQNLDSMMRRDSLLGRYNTYGRTESIMRLMKVVYAGQYDSEEKITRFNCTIGAGDLVIPSGGLPYIIPGFDLTSNDTDTSSSENYKLDNDSLIVFLDSVNRLHFISPGSDRVKDTVFIAGMEPILHHLPDSLVYDLELSKEAMTLPIDGPRWTGKLVLKEFRGTKKDSTIRIESIQGCLLLRRRDGH